MVYSLLYTYANFWCRPDCMGTDVLNPQAEPWRNQALAPSLPEVYRSLHVPRTADGLRKLFAFAGPGFLVAVGYMDPGNWATDLAGGSRYNYTLLSVIMLSNLMAVLLQSLAIKLGVVTGRDLAQACRDHFSRKVSFAFWGFAEIAIAACDLAEVIGSAIALNLLFQIPLLWGVCLTALDVLIILFLQQRAFRFLDALVIVLTGTIAVRLRLHILSSRPSTVFAPRPAAAGGNPPLAGTPGRQVVIEGFLHIRLRPRLRRLISRRIAIAPAIVVTALWGEKGTADLLIFSQVILSMQLSFAVFPLVMFTSDRRKMGEFVNAPWLRALSWSTAALIATLNAWLLIQAIRM